MESEFLTVFEESYTKNESEVSTISGQSNSCGRLYSAVVPVLLIAIGYIDPGKWAAVADGGARYGSDLFTIMLVFNLAAVLCQYLSARIAFVTGKNLVQVCSEEYDKITCIFLGILAELSMINFDLAMVLGTANGLNLIFGIDLFTCVLLTAAEAALSPLLAIFVENGKAKFLCICMASFILLFYFLGVLSIQTEFPFSFNGTLMKSSGECAFALMSILGASIMPHNFYLHSSIVQKNKKPTVVSKGTLCNDQLFAILCIFGGIFLVNYVLLNLAANEFHSMGLSLLTFQDALSLMDQVFRSPIALFVLILIMFLSNQITAVAWNIGRQVVLHDFLGLDIPGWLHRITIRVVAIVPALYCAYNSGGGGIYQLLIFTQVVVALLLPASVIPLFRIASSRCVMGVYKVSQLVDFLSLMMFIGMLGLKILFVIEMIFGHSDWVCNLRWNMGGNTSLPYAVLLITATVSLSLMLWLVATPLKSAILRTDAQSFKHGTHTSLPKLGEANSDDFNGYYVDEPTQEQEHPLGLENSMGSDADVLTLSPDMNLSKTVLDSDTVTPLTIIEKNCSHITFLSSSVCELEDSETTVDKVLVSTSSDDVPQDSPGKSESKDLVEKSLILESNLQNKKDDQINTWETKESSKGALGSSPSFTSDGPASFMSVSGKSDDVGSGAGSLLRLAGLGRAARCQLTTILDEFWGQLFDRHGVATQDAKAKKLDVLLGVDSKVDPKSASAWLKVDSSPRDSAGYFPSKGGRGSDPLIKSDSYDDPPKQQRGQHYTEPFYLVQRGSPSLSFTNVQLLDAYTQNPRCNTLDAGEKRYSSLRLPAYLQNPICNYAGEKRYSSLRLPASSIGYDNQPATIHGYRTASYLDQISKEQTSDYLNGQIDTQSLKSPSSGSLNLRDSLNSERKPQNGLRLLTPPGFPSIPISRNSSLQAEVSAYDLCSSIGAENVGGTVSAKKFYSLPDISGLSHHHCDALLSERSVQRNSPTGYGPFSGRYMNERSLYSSLLSRPGAPSEFDDYSYSKIGTVQSSLSEENASSVDLEAKLLKSFRRCIVKLLKLVGSDWLFNQNDGIDEDLLERVAAREKFLYEAETREINKVVKMDEYKFSSDRKTGLTPKNDEADYAKFNVTSVPQCGDGCIWKVDLIISFGVWCIHRILDLSLMESRPELWGKYTYVLNRLQGIIDLAFSKARTPATPCFCLQVPASYQQTASPPISNGSLPRPIKQGRGKRTTATMLLEIVKDVEVAISCRKGRTGTAAGDVAFPKGKENLASVLKRYKRRLANKPVHVSSTYGS